MIRQPNSPVGFIRLSSSCSRQCWPFRPATARPIRCRARRTKGARNLFMTSGASDLHKLLLLWIMTTVAVFGLSGECRGQEKQEPRLLRSISCSVNRFALSPDGTTIATPSESGIKLWKRKRGQVSFFSLRHVLGGHHDHRLRCGRQPDRGNRSFGQHDLVPVRRRQRDGGYQRDGQHVDLPVQRRQRNVTPIKGTSYFLLDGGGVHAAKGTFLIVFPVRQ